jgi:predicted ABC-type ATPase
MKRLYVVARCNGAGKTTASYTVSPKILDCEKFVNADEIAKGLSPFNPVTAAIQAGRLMLDKINNLISSEQDFAFETTLATKNYKNFILRAKKNGFQVSLIYFWLHKLPSWLLKGLKSG